MGEYRRNNDSVGGDFEGTSSCRKCHLECEKALEFVEAVKDLLDEFFEDDKHDNHDCCCKNDCCHSNHNYWGR